MEKEVRPEELIRYPQFFGIYAGELASFERQLSNYKRACRRAVKRSYSNSGRRVYSSRKSCYGKARSTARKMEERGIKIN